MNTDIFGMEKKDMLSKRILTIIFGIYLVVLLIVLIKFQAIGTITNDAINIIPFSDYSEYPGMRDILRNIVGNIVIFIPYGVYIHLLGNDDKNIKKVILIVSSSLLIEVFQLLLKSGHADIDDVIYNSLGGVGGIVFIDFIRHYLSEKWIDRIIIGGSIVLGGPIVIIFIMHYIF